MRTEAWIEWVEVGTRSRDREHHGQRNNPQIFEQPAPSVPRPDRSKLGTGPSRAARHAFRNRPTAAAPVVDPPSLRQRARPVTLAAHRPRARSRCVMRSTTRWSSACNSGAATSSCSGNGGSSSGFSPNTGSNPVCAFLPRLARSIPLNRAGRLCQGMPGTCVRCLPRCHPGVRRSTSTTRDCPFETHWKLVRSRAMGDHLRPTAAK
jgi:hypothetical protein